jgi:hyperosmotically inducible periplasmic protein
MISFTGGMMKILAVAAMGAVLMLGTIGCTNKSAPNQIGSTNASKLDDSQIKNNLKQANLGDVKVDVNNDKKVVTLSGDVKSDAAKQQAEDIAKSNASGYVVANEVGVRPDNDTNAKKVDSNTDDAIKSRWKAMEAENNWGDQHIRTSVKNGVLTLKGDVDTPAQRETVERSAAKIDGVQQVVNELSVKNASR